MLVPARGASLMRFSSGGVSGQGQAKITRQRRPVRSPDAVWHLVRAVGRGDAQVSQALTSLGFSVYSPRVLEMRPLAKRQMSANQRRAGIEISRPQLVALFPRYLFVRFDMGRVGWRQVFAIAGVAGLVCEGGLPVPISQAVLDRIRSIELDGAIVAREQKLRLVFEIGQHVVINSGPFREFHAVMQSALDLPFDEVDPTTRVRILLNLFGGDQVVELDAWQVDAI
jgi:transcription antitermination factor NusG